MSPPPQSKMSVFARLPQDMLQWEISRFLDPISRAEFNCVLKNDERIYKKFAANYALRHHIVTVKKAYENNVIALNHALGLLGYDEVGAKKVKLSFKHLNNIFNLFTNPVNLIVVSYQRNLREILLRLVETWEDDDQELYEYCAFLQPRKAEVQENARRMAAAVRPIAFVHHVNIVGFTPIF